MSAPIELLKHVPMFERLSDKELKTLAATFTEKTFRSGQELTSEGQGAAGFFVIESGEADVLSTEHAGARSARATTSARSR